MSTYISILRGINVVGHKMIKMEALRQVYENLRFKEVQTYIQSGNVVFRYKMTRPEDLEEKIGKAIKAQFGFEVPVLVKELEELKQVVKNNPFIADKKKDIAHLHVTFLSAVPEQANVNKLKDGQYQGDEFHVLNNIIYLYCPNGYGKSKLSNNILENKLKVMATTRNWKTTLELVRIAESIEK